MLVPAHITHSLLIGTVYPINSIKFNYLHCLYEAIIGLRGLSWVWYEELYWWRRDLFILAVTSILQSSMSFVEWHLSLYSCYVFETVVCIHIYLLIIYLWNVPPFSPALSTTKQLSHHAIHSSFHQYWYNCINIILVLISAVVDLPRVITSWVWRISWGF